MCNKEENKSFVITFSKVYHNSTYMPYCIDYVEGLGKDEFSTLRELKTYYNIKKLEVIGETFAITGSGKKLIFKVYSATVNKEKK